LTQAAARVDRSHVGCLKVSGHDALDLLNRLSTNKLDEIAPGHGMGTVLTTSKGRVIDLLFITALEDYLLVITSPGRQQKVADWIDFYTFGEDVEVRDMTEETSMLGIVGPEAPAAVQQVLGTDVAAMDRFDAVSSGDRIIVRTDFPGCTAFDIVMARSEAADVTELFESRGVRAADPDVAEFVRVENRIPGPDGELTEDYNPLEARLLPYVHFNKDCYIGQEVVARLNTYDKVQKHLVALDWEEELLLDPGTALMADDKNVGTVTSNASAPWTGRRAALAYVRKSHVQPGTQLEADAGGSRITVSVKGLADES
jgi:folate-binding protein YgfZ